MKFVVYSCQITKNIEYNTLHITVYLLHAISVRLFILKKFWLNFFSHCQCWVAPTPLLLQTVVVKADVQT